MTDLTDRQREVWTFIRTYQQAHSRPPTLREIMLMMGVTSANGVHEVLAAIEKKGWLRRITTNATSARNVLAIRPNETRDMEQAAAAEVKIHAAARDAFLTGATLSDDAAARSEDVFAAWWTANRDRFL